MGITFDNRMHYLVLLSFILNLISISDIRGGWRGAKVFQELTDIMVNPLTMQSGLLEHYFPGRLSVIYKVLRISVSDHIPFHYG